MNKCDPKSRQQTIDTIKELTPDELDYCLQAERFLLKLSNWEARDAIREFAEYNRPCSVQEYLKENNWIGVVWSLMDIKRDINNIFDLIKQ